MPLNPQSAAEKSAPIDHLFIKALAQAGIQFPASKKEIASRLADATLRLSEAETVLASSLVEDVGPEHFENGAAFFCAYHSALYGKTYLKAFLSRRLGAAAE